MRNSRKGEIITALTIGAFVLISAITVITSFFSNNSSKTTTSRASACVDDPGGLPNPNPTTYTWACNVWESHARTQKSCTRREECPLNNQANNGDNTYQYVDPNSSNICYQGSCLQLQYRGSSQQPTVAPSCNDIVEEVYVRSSGSTAECYVQTGAESGTIGCYARSNPSEAGRGCNWNETVRANGKFYQKFTCSNINTNMIIAGMNYAACRDDWAKAKFWSSIGAAPTPAASFEHSNLPTAVPTATTAPAATPTTAVQSPTETPEVTPGTTPGTPATCTPACTGATHCVGTTCVPDKQVGCTPACSSKQECVNNQCVTSTVSQNCSDYGANCGTCLTALNVKGKNTGPNCLWSSTVDLGSKVSASSNASTSGTCIPDSKQCTVPGDKYNYNAKCWNDTSKIQCKYDGGGMNCIGDDVALDFKDSTGQCYHCAAHSKGPAVKQDAAKCNPPTPSATTCSQVLSATTSTPACALNGNKYSYCATRGDQPKGLYDSLDQCKTSNNLASTGPTPPLDPSQLQGLGTITIHIRIKNTDNGDPVIAKYFQTNEMKEWIRTGFRKNKPMTHIFNENLHGSAHERDIDVHAGDTVDVTNDEVLLTFANIARYDATGGNYSYKIEVKFLNKERFGGLSAQDIATLNGVKFRDPREPNLQVYTEINEGPNKNSRNPKDPNGVNYISIDNKSNSGGIFDLHSYLNFWVLYLNKVNDPGVVVSPTLFRFGSDIPFLDNHIRPRLFLSRSVSDATHISELTPIKGFMDYEDMDDVKNFPFDQAGLNEYVFAYTEDDKTAHIELKYSCIKSFGGGERNYSVNAAWKPGVFTYINTPTQPLVLCQ